MGLDYIRNQTGKPWKRRWDGGLDRMKTPTLLDLTISEGLRMVSAELLPDSGVKVGDSYIVEPDGEYLIISRGRCPVGRITKPPAEALAAIAGCGGYAEGVIERVGLFGDNAEVSLR
ncbi:hypothetical protein [Pseudoxanthomonas sp. CF125]|uniref:hypothetical protein n=1 Tax=Pseudoxanthomonas sp. CF125 TaxID=1855303 RepID=UPI00088D3EC4|nr:hypothetical protein [Pseudoxanthomonas sp. CF125]SDQ82278.1 hypothetical protein SAMN05216569_2190 [Pseudoxanthomonas sp. CF125]